MNIIANCNPVEFEFSPHSLYLISRNPQISFEILNCNILA